MELEGSQNRVGRETEWRWKRDGIAVEGSWEIVGQVDGGLTAGFATRNLPDTRYPGKMPSGTGI